MEFSVNPLAGTIGDLIKNFTRYIEIAEAEIAAAKQRHPAHAEAIDRVFAIAGPPPLLRDKAPAIYHAHVRELCERAATGEAFALGTEAEVLCAILATATRTPLTHAGYNLAERLAYKILPNAVRSLGETAGREEWPGQFEEDLAEARRKLQTTRR